MSLGALRKGVGANSTAIAQEEASVPDDRCGYSHEGTVVTEPGDVTCWRPVWNDHGRCIWHSNEDVKPLEAVEAMAPTGPERLDGAYLSGLHLGDVDWFEECSLLSANFTDVDMQGASLAGADLRESSFDNVDLRNVDLTDTNLEDATLTTCDLRRAAFGRSRIDQTIFRNVRISRNTTFQTPVYYERALDDAESEEEYQELAQAAVWSYREIHTLHRNNALPYEARVYYLKEKNVRRRLAWHERNYFRAVTAEGSRWVTGYGMSPWRVIGTAAVVIVGSALLYPTIGGLETRADSGGSITWRIENPESVSRFFFVFVMLRSLYFSTITFTTLGYGDITPVGTWARALAGAESLLGAMLTALLVFVLSRRIR